MGTDSVSNCAKTSSGGDSRCRLSTPPVIFEGGECRHRGLSAPCPMEEFSLRDSPSWPKKTPGFKTPPAHQQVGEVLVSRLHQGPAVVERKSRCPFWGWGWHRYKGGWGHLHGPRPHKQALLVVNPAPSPVWGRPEQSFHISSTAGRKSIM